jgi:hypothetical protein
MSASGQTTVIDTTSKMDKPCTIIHMLECPVGLPTNISVNGNMHYFSKFGETRTFRRQELQNIASLYRDWFDRGIFVLGDDCTDQIDELGINVLGNPIPVATYNKMEKMSDADFDALIKKISSVQRVQVARTWAQRYADNKSGYKNIEKIRILNKYTKDNDKFKNGLLSSLLKDITNEEE